MRERIQLDRRDAEPDLDIVLGQLVFAAEVQFLGLDILAQELLGKGRSIVWGMLFVADQNHAPLVAVLVQAGHKGTCRVACTDNDERIHGRVTRSKEFGHRAKSGFVEFQTLRARANSSAKCPVGFI